MIKTMMFITKVKELGSLMLLPGII